MSFSSEVKDELLLQNPSSRHCQLAELLALFQFGARIVNGKNGGLRILIQTENYAVARKCFTLLKKTFIICTDILVRSTKGSKTRTYILSIDDSDSVMKLIEALRLSLDCESQLSFLVKNTCCKRAYIRGAFLSAGSISDPEHSYHYEIACDTLLQATAIKNLINSFEPEIHLEAKTTQRKKYYVVYVKEGAQIVDILNLMGAHKSLMDMENLRIVKEMRNSVNRRVNCETANINKTVSAAVKQIEDIRYIRDHGAFKDLSLPLLEMAEVRLENPDASLKELGELLEPKVGKSGVNHRLRKLSEIADKLRI